MNYYQKNGMVRDGAANVAPSLIEGGISRLYQ